MPKKRMTDGWLKSAKPLEGQSRTDYFDTNTKGLVCRVTAKGKLWNVRYRRVSDGKQRNIKIGGYPALSYAQAREKTSSVLLSVSRGEDPQLDKLTRYTGKPKTFNELAERYLTGHAEINKRSGKKDRRSLEKDVIPFLDGVLIEKIQRAHLSGILDAIIKRGAPIQSNRTFEIIRKLFNWSYANGLIDNNPCFGLQKPARENRRDIVLRNDEEIVRFWEGLPTARMSDPTRMILRLCLVTAQRVGEVTGMRRSELDLANAEWHLPADRVKNGNAHTVPLSDLAMTLIKQQLEAVGDDEYLFQNRSGKQMTTNAVSVAMDRSRAGLGFDDLVAHDLRRTAATSMASMKVSRTVIDKLLNHVTADRSSVIGTYDRHAYKDEKRAAMNAWGGKLEIALGMAQPATNVVRLRG